MSIAESHCKSRKTHSLSMKRNTFISNQQNICTRQYPKSFNHKSKTVSKFNAVQRCSNFHSTTSILVYTALTLNTALQIPQSKINSKTANICYHYMSKTSQLLISTPTELPVNSSVFIQNLNHLAS